MRLILGGVLAVLTGLGTSGCVPQITPPSYTQVVDETEEALNEIVEQVDGPKTVLRLPDIDPYPCDDPLIGGHESGYFYTGNWEVHLDAGSDVDHVVVSLLSRLGEEWREYDVGLPPRTDSIHIIKDETAVKVAVVAVDDPSAPAVRLTAISRCGENAEGES